MSDQQLGIVLFALVVLLTAARLLAWACVRLGQPALIGEILAGFLLGPVLLRALEAGWPWLPGSSGTQAGAALVLDFVASLGLLLLMLLSGAEVRRVLASDDRRATVWLVAVGTSVPFAIALFVGSRLSLDSLAGPAGAGVSLILVLAVAATVMSIPVISRIFHDLGILRTRFASLMLGVAILEDVVLWCVLALATALADPTGQGRSLAGILVRVGLTVLYMLLGFAWAPRALRALAITRVGRFLQGSPTAYVMLVLFAYTSAAAALDVNLVFAAFLAGFGLVTGVADGERRPITESLEAISKVGFAVFIPFYFVSVGYRLDFGGGFSPVFLAVFLVGSSLVRVLGVSVASLAAGFRRLDIVNLAVTANARGGPGIVAATVAFSSGIINAACFTTLVLTAILTSQAAGAWLAFVIRRGLPLLSAHGVEAAGSADAVALAGVSGPTRIS